MDLRKIGTAKELVFEMDRISEAIRLFYNAGSIAVSLLRCDENGQERKIELSLERAEIGEAVESALHRRMDALRALRGSEHFRKDFLALINEEALKIDPATAEMIWINGDTLDPYALGPESPFQPDTLCDVYSPENKRSVWIGDLPIGIREALRLKRAAKQNAGREPCDASAGPPQGECAVTNPSSLPPWMTA
jgi:hypothetical protein